MCTLQVGNLKERYDHTLFLRHLPAELKPFLAHLQALDYADAPDYSALRGLLGACATRKGVHDVDLFDWERVSTVGGEESMVTSAVAIATTVQAPVKDGALVAATGE